MLNGNGVQGAAANASYLLGAARLRDAAAAERPRSRTRRADYVPHGDLLRPGAAGLEARRAGAAEADRSPPTCRSCRGGRSCSSLDPGSMLLVVLGQTFHGSSRRRRTRTSPTHQPAFVRYDSAPGDRPAEAARAQGAVPARGADRARAQLVPRHAAGRQAGAPLLDRPPGRPQGGPARLPHRQHSTGGSRRRTGTARPRSPTRASATISAGASSTSTTRARTCTWSCCTRTARATGS